jgi:hypothetical protein
MNFESEQNGANVNGASEGDEQQSFAQGEENFVVEEHKSSVSRGTMVMFVIMILSAGGFYYMYRKAGPSKANAAISKESVEANKTITSFLSGGDANIKSMLTLLKSTEKRVQQFLTYPNTKQIPLSDLKTNPFRQVAEAPKIAAPDTTGLSEAAEKKRREEERQAILRAVQSLQLQSIMYSTDRSVCMVNSNLYREGQSIENFTIEKISPASIVVKNGPYRFELRIQR